MNGWFAPSYSLADGRSNGARGVMASSVIAPARKILLVNEDPATMLNAAFHPGGTASRGRFVAHSGRINLAFVDGHIERWTDATVHERQGERASDYFDPYWGGP